MTKIEKVKNHIKRLINTNKLVGGQKLPSCREMSNKLDVNKITVNKAYNELEDEHIVYCIPKGGFYVVDDLYIQRDESSDINFRDIIPDKNLIPYKEFNHSIDVAVSLFKRDAFLYNSPCGIESLRKLLKSTFEEDGVYAKHDQIIITNGAQQAITLCIEAILHKNNGKILVEDPTYDLVLEYLRLKDISTICIERYEEGYDFKKLESIFKNHDVCAFYVMSRYHNPTGYSLSESDKRRVVELAREYDVLIIEDDYLGDLGNKQSLPMHYYDTYNKTIYIRSFSKTFMPGIRLGAAILPKCLVDEVFRIKRLNDLNTSTIAQVSLESFIKSGMYKRQVEKVKKCYKDKLQRARNIISSINPTNISCFIPNQGIFIWIKINSSIDYSNIETILEKQGFIVKNGDSFFYDKNKAPNQHIRLCLSCVSKSDINKISALILTINELAAIKSQS